MAESTQNKKNDNTKSDSDVEEDINTVGGRILQMFNIFARQEENETMDPLLKSFDLKGAAEYMSKCSNIIVMAGAGISTSAGIPDFRSPGTGLYSQLEKYNLPFAEAIFHLDFFRENPKPFFLLAKELYPRNFTPTPTHFFFRLLNEKQKLLRIFTQNIDSLERIAGVPDEKLVEAHGTFLTAHCLDCRKEYNLEFVKEIIFRDEIPYCEDCKGIIKPDIIFFGERLPDRYRQCTETDFEKADFLIIIGTSLKVAPFNRLLTYVKKECPRLLINMEAVGRKSSDFFPNAGLQYESDKNWRDVFHKSTCDDGAIELAKLLGWEDEFNQLLKSEGLTIDKLKEKAMVASNTMEDSANKLAEQIAKVTLNNEESKKNN